MQHKILLKYLLWIVGVVGLSWEANAQVNNDCRQVFNTNRLICGTASFTDNSNGTGQVNEFNATDFPNNNRGCLSSGERQSAWYAFQVGTSGTITFTIIPNTMSNDYDFAVWGPFNNSGAVSLCQNLGTPIRCNYSGTSGLTGLNSTSTQASVGAGGSPFSSSINATAGQLYILMVDNFSTSNSGFTFVWNNNNFTMPNGTVVNGGGGTASLSPLSAGFSAPTLSCNRATFTNTSSTCKTGAGVSMSYSWNFGDGQPVSGVNTQANPTYFFSAPGTYTVTLTATLNSSDADNGKTSTYTQQVVITGTPPTASITGLNANYCIDSPPVTLTGTGNPVGGTSTFTIERNVVAGVPAQTLTSQTQFNPATLGIGNHNVILEYSSPTNANCRRRVVQAVRVNDKPTADITGLASSYCPGSPAVNLVGTPAGGSFTVNGTAATQFNPTALGVGNHTVVYTVTDALTTCTVTKTQTVSISGVATPAITGLNSSYCVGGSAFNLVGTPAGGTFTINGTAATQFNPATLGIGNHVVAYTLSGCPASATQNVSVTANPTLSFTGLNTQYCISASAFNLAATPTGGIFKINNVVVTQFNPATLGVGTHIVRYEYTDPTNSSCSNFITQNVQVINPATINFVGLNTSYCVSASAVTLNATPAGGTFTINGTAATQFNPATLGVGNHTVIYNVTDGNGCPNTRTQNVQVTALPVLTNNVAVSYCLSSAAFTMTGTPTGSTFTINGTPATQFNPATLGIGNYTVVQSFTDANGCSNTLTKTVTINVKPVLNFVSLNTSYCINAPTFNLQATPTGGTFTINNVTATQFNPNSLGVGIHTVKYNYVSPADPGCFNDITQTVEVKPLPTVSITGLNNNYCINVAAFNLTGTPVGGTFTINGTPATQFNPATLGAGNYNVIYSFTDASGCTNTATRNVVINPLPVLSFNNLSDTYCLSSASFSLSATPTGGTFTINGNPATQFNPATLGLGTYNVVYSLTDANGCSNQINKSVQIVPKPTLNFVSLNTQYCVNNPVFTLNATPTGGTFTINGTNATQFNPALLGVGNHTVKYNYVSPTDAGCFNEITQVVEVKAIPNVSIIGLNSAYCVDAAGFALAGLPVGGTFTINNVTATQFNPATLGAGLYNVVYSFTDVNGCTSTATKSVNVNPLPTLSFNNLKDNYCLSSASFNLSATPTGGTFTINGNPATQFNPATLGLGLYNIVYNFTDANGCSNQISKNVNVTPKPTLNFVGLNNAYCASEPTFNLQATPTGGTFTINGVNATQFNTSTLGAGNYVVKYNYIDPSDTGCFNEITQNVVINALPQIQFQNVNANYCVSSLTPVNPVAFVTYGNGTTQNVPLTSFIPATQGTGTQTISFTAIDPLTNCQRTSTFNYTINALPTLNFVNVPDQYCYQSGVLTLQATPAGGTFKVQGANTNVLNPSLFTIGQFVNIEYTFTDGNSCSNVINKTVELISPPNYTESVENVDVCPGTLGTRLEALTLQEEIALIASGVQVRYSWSNGSTSRFITLRNANDSGTYVVLISDGTGCPIEKVTFNAVISCEPKLILPTAFSPNGDGLNDTWDIFGKDLAKLDLRVYNRWGEAVFIAYSQETRWDGNYNGMPLPAGTYVWKAKYVNALNQQEVVVKQGMVTIVK